MQHFVGSIGRRGTVNLTSGRRYFSTPSSQVNAVKIPMKYGKTEHFLQFAKKLQRDQKTLKELLAEEEIFVESIFLHRSPLEGDYLVLYQRAKDLYKAHTAFTESTHPINVEFRKLMDDTWDTRNIVQLECVLDATNGLK